MKIYVVRNKEGKFFRPRGFGGYGPQWVDDMQCAKIYPKIGPAKARAVFWGKAAPQYGVPDVVEYEIDPSAGRVIDMKPGVASSIKKDIKALQKRFQSALEREDALRKNPPMRTGFKRSDELEKEISSFQQRLKGLTAATDVV